MIFSPRVNKIIGGTLLVAGTTIGAAILALPTTLGLAGFFPSALVCLLTWVFFLYTALLFLEATLWTEEDSNLISIAHDTIGRWGMALCWVLYLYLLYSLTLAYLAGMGDIIVDLIEYKLGMDVPDWIGIVPLFFLGIIAFEGTAWVDYFNRTMMIGLAVAFFAIIAGIAPHTTTSHLYFTHWTALIFGFSITITSFGYHIIIPTLATYLQRDVKSLLLAIFIGSLLPLGVYLLWIYTALGVIENHALLEKAAEQGVSTSQLLSQLLRSNWLAPTITAFAFFSIVTSLIGVSKSLFDFLGDGLKIKKNLAGRILLYLLTFIPPFILSELNPKLFVRALEMAGGFGVVTLLGLMPALMVWYGRYYRNLEGPFRAPGGRFALILVMLLALGAFTLEFINTFLL